MKNSHKCSSLLEKFWDAGISTFANFSNLSPVHKKEQIMEYQLASTINDFLTISVESNNALLFKLEKLYGSSVSPLLNSSLLVTARYIFVLLIISIYLIKPS